MIEGPKGRQRQTERELGTKGVWMTEHWQGGEEARRHRAVTDLPGRKGKGKGASRTLRRDQENFVSAGHRVIYKMSIVQARQAGGESRTLRRDQENFVSAGRLEGRVEL